jgi:CRISPR/Cas system CSM-associated protein Csm3 (group 7 of RAMP superfamily)
LPGWIEIEGTLHAGENKDGEDVWGIDSLSIGGHASEELEAVWDKRFLAPKGIKDEETKAAFDPDFAVVTWNDGKQRVPYIPGSSLRGPLRHALSRTPSKHLVNELFGTVSASAKLLIRDALPDPEKAIKLAWIQHHAEDEFAGSTYESAKFDRVAVMEGSFRWKMVLEDATDDQKAALRDLLVLAQAGQIGIGGGQWRGHGWLRWETNGLDQLQTEPNVHA